MDIPWFRLGLFAIMLNIMLSMGPLGICLLLTFVILAWVIETFVSLCILILTLLYRLSAWLWRKYQTKHGGHP